MNYVFLDVETTGLDYKNNELILLNGLKVDKDFNVMDQLRLYIKPQGMVPKRIFERTKIAKEELDNGYNLKEALEKLKIFLKNCSVIGYHLKFDLSFLLVAMYNTKVDMSFWYVDLEKLIDKKNYKKGMELNDYINLTKAYMTQNNINDLEEFTKVRPREWNMIFRGLNYPEYLGDYENYSFYLADLSEERYLSFLAGLKEIRLENFTKKELLELKKKYNIKILFSILDLNEETMQISRDYYIMSYGGKVEDNTKWGKNYIEKIRSAAEFINKHNEPIEITCYESVEELNEKTAIIEEKTMATIKSKIVREKKKWSRWENEK